MARPRALGLTALVALLCVSACAGDGGAAADGPTPTVATSPTSPETTSQTDGPTTATPPQTTTPPGSTRTAQPPDPVADGFVYIPWGPDDPPIPSEYAALAASAG